jgi:hypothetical protein
MPKVRYCFEGEGLDGVVRNMGENKVRNCAKRISGPSQPPLPHLFSALLGCRLYPEQLASG